MTLNALVVGLVIAGCIENNVEGEGDKGRFDSVGGTGFGPDAATGDTAPRDSASNEPGECSDEAPAADAEPITAACGGEARPIDTELVELWRVGLDGFACEVRASRLADSNDDGVIDADDPMQIVVDAGWERVQVIDHEGTPTSYAFPESYRAVSATADVNDDALGAEIVVSWSTQNHDEFLGLADESGTLSSEALPNYVGGQPWITDLEGDGQLEVLLDRYILDLDSGATVALIDGPGGPDYAQLASADLDGDGLEEIFSADWYGGEVWIYEADGSPRARCVSGGGPIFNATYAVGNFDGDDDGELVAAGDGYVAICNPDGGEVARTVAFIDDQPTFVAIGELDGDTAPELVITSAHSTVAFDTDLSVLWTIEHGEDWTWTPLSLADLDGDGLHEVLVHGQGSLDIHDARGSLVLSYPFEDTRSYSWKSQPVVADIDADGLAEIVIGGENLVVLENADGGWPIEGAEYDWPASDRHAGERTITGGVERPNPFWLERGQNVWHGLPAGARAYPELGVAITDTCVESCDGEAVVTLRVTNTSAETIEGDVQVQLAGLDSGEILATATLSPAPAPGTGEYLTIRIAAADFGSGLRATIDADDNVWECDTTPNEDEYHDIPCP